MLFLHLAVILLLMLLNGLFAMAEMAMVAARKARLQHAADRGRDGARIALELQQDPGRLLSTVQIGITVTAILAGTFGGATLSEPLAEYLERLFPSLGSSSHAVSITAVVVGISYLSLIIGELVPKRIALSRPEIIASALARTMRVISRVAAPIEWVLSASSDLVLRLLPLSKNAHAPVTEEEINLMLREGAAAGHFHFKETEIAQMALRLGDRRVAALMTPRTQIEWLNLADSEEENRRRICESGHSCFPVIDGDPEVVKGILLTKDVLINMLGSRGFDLRGPIRSPLYLPNTVTALRALEMLKKSGEPMALVVDEYGVIEGLLTLTDILETLVGDIASPGEQGTPAVVRREDGSWIIDGMLPLDELKDVIGLTELPDEEEGDFHTLGGFIMAQMNRIPKVTDHFTIDGYRFEVVVMDGRRVDRALIVPPPAEEGERERGG